VPSLNGAPFAFPEDNEFQHEFFSPHQMTDSPLPTKMQYSRKDPIRIPETISEGLNAGLELANAQIQKIRERLENPKRKKLWLSFGAATVAYMLFPSNEEVGSEAHATSLAQPQEAKAVPGQLESERKLEHSIEEHRNLEELKNTVVVIDAGHGGVDGGAHGVFDGQAVYESPYTMDVAERLKKMVEDYGGTVVMTHSDDKDPTPQNVHPSEVLPRVIEDDKFPSGEVVRGPKQGGLRARAQAVRDAIQHNPGKEVVFISIHFDSLGKETIKGMSVVVPEDEQRLGEGYRNAFELVHRQRLQYSANKDSWGTFYPVSVSGRSASTEETHYLGRNLHLLDSSKNLADNKVLVELGNFANKDDVYRIRSAEIRQKYTRVIFYGFLESLDV
jgi:N-acetylmuramoyl-L-alanine amidase